MLAEILTLAALTSPFTLPIADAPCERPVELQRVVFSAEKYPNIRRHYRDAVAAGWTTRLVVNRGGADARRRKAVRVLPVLDGYDRDEYPPAVGRGRGPGLSAGSNPRGWRADVAYVPMSENRSHGASMGAQLRKFCNGVAFRYVFI